MSSLAIAAGSFAAQGISSLKSKLAEESPQMAVQVAKSAMAGLNDKRADSLISYTQSARVEPILLLDARAAQIPFIQDVLHTMSSLFTGYYLQAIALDTTLSNIKVMRRLDKFAPDRDLIGNTINFLGMESRNHIGLEFSGCTLGLEAYGVAPSMEALENYDEALSTAMDRAKIKKTVEQAMKDPEPGKPSTLGSSVKDVTKLATEIGNLAVGKIIEITIEENGMQAKLPVSIRLRPLGMPSTVITELLTVGGTDNSFRARWRAFKADELKFWRDLVLARDRIDAYYASATKDVTGYYKTVAARQLKNGFSAMFSKEPSIGMASSLIVISEQTRIEIERKLGARLDDFKTRERMFQSTMAMLLAVVDPEWESVTIFHRGIDQATQLGIKAIQSAGKGDKTDLTDILKAYQLGQAPGRL